MRGWAATRLNQQLLQQLKTAAAALAQPAARAAVHLLCPARASAGSHGGTQWRRALHGGLWALTSASTARGLAFATQPAAAVGKTGLESLGGATHRAAMPRGRAPQQASSGVPATERTAAAADKHKPLHNRQHAQRLHEGTDVRGQAPRRHEGRPPRPAQVADQHVQAAQQQVGAQRAGRGHNRQQQNGHAGHQQLLARQQELGQELGPGADSSGGANGGDPPGTGSGSTRPSRRARQRWQRRQRQQAEVAAGLGPEPRSSDDDASAIPAVTEAAESIEEQAVGDGVAERQPPPPACQLAPPVVLQDDAHPIRDADISHAAWSVLCRLRSAGHEAYVVGGTIRDLLLGGTPKDYDLLTSAELHQIKRLFSRCLIVGRSFPVCHVHAEGGMVEVSSFSTNTDARRVPPDASIHVLRRQKPAKRPSSSRDGDVTWAAARADNAARRDFTVNGLLYDPFSRLLFDAVGGVEDCAARRLRTICPPRQSFAADPARILRGVRLAARAGLAVDDDTAAAMEELVTSISQLPQGRLQMELSSLLGYGAAHASLALMWRLGLLDLLLPLHALYLKQEQVPRSPRSAGSGVRMERDLLFQLAAELDRHATPQKPVDPAIWLAMLAAPLVAQRCEVLAATQPSGQQQQRRRGRQRKPVQPDTGEPAAIADSVSSRSGSDVGMHSVGDVAGLSPGWATPQQQYLEQYGQVVADVLEAMQQPLGAATLSQLGRRGKQLSKGLSSEGGGGRRRRGAAPQGALLPCVLPRAALLRAGSLLMLEAELRGRPELRQLLDSVNAAAGGAAAVPKGAQGHVQPGWQPKQQQQQQQQRELGSSSTPRSPQQQQHQQQQQLWQRLQQTLAESEPSQESAAEQEDSAVASQPEAEDASSNGKAAKHARRPLRRQGRRLGHEERLVLLMLGNPRLGFAQRTLLPL